jgi:hypothetical protein
VDQLICSFPSHLRIIGARADTDADFCGTGKAACCSGAYVASGSILRHTSGWTTRTPATSCYVGGTMKTKLMKVSSSSALSCQIQLLSFTTLFTRL